VKKAEKKFGSYFGVNSREGEGLLALLPAIKPVWQGEGSVWLVGQLSDLGTGTKQKGHPNAGVAFLTFFLQKVPRY